MKNPWLAALLNLFPGAGYLYTGSRQIFGFMLLAFWPIVIFGAFLEPAAYNAAGSADTGPTPISMILAFLVLWLAFPVDAYLEVKHNNALQQDSK
jgi:hypothetical protein